jgi:hypothetical protein
MIIANYFIYNFKVFCVLKPLKKGVNSEERILIYEFHIDVLGNYTKKEILHFNQFRNYSAFFFADSKVNGKKSGVIIFIRYFII